MRVILVVVIAGVAVEPARPSVAGPETDLVAAIAMAAVGWLLFGAARRNTGGTWYARTAFADWVGVRGGLAAVRCGSRVSPPDDLTGAYAAGPGSGRRTPDGDGPAMLSHGVPGSLVGGSSDRFREPGVTVLLLTFAVVLLLAVLVSALAHRTILSTAVLFLAAGFILGPDTTGVLDADAETPIVGTLVELALFAVLFTDGMRVGWADLRSAWRLPGRALVWGLPLTLLITALAAYFVVGLGWA
jgi:hypothetical protein